LIEHKKEQIYSLRLTKVRYPKEEYLMGGMIFGWLGLKSRVILVDGLIFDRVG
jgi:hypothetical protein